MKQTPEQLAKAYKDYEAGRTTKQIIKDMEQEIIICQHDRDNAKSDITDLKKWYKRNYHTVGFKSRKYKDHERLIAKLSKTVFNEEVFILHLQRQKKEYQKKL